MIVVSDERDGHQRHLDDDGEQVGQAEAEDGPVDARVAQRLCPQNGRDHEGVADEAEDEVEGAERPGLLLFNDDVRFHGCNFQA